MLPTKSFRVCGSGRGQATGWLMRLGRGSLPWQGGAAELAAHFLGCGHQLTDHTLAPLRPARIEAPTLLLEKDWWPQSWPTTNRAQNMVPCWDNKSQAE